MNIAERLILREYQRNRLVLCDYRIMGGWTADVLSMTPSGYADEFCIAQAHSLSGGYPDLSFLSMRTKDHLKVQPCRVWIVTEYEKGYKTNPSHLPGVGVLVFDKGSFRVVKKPLRIHTRIFITPSSVRQIMMELNNRAHDEFLARHILSVKSRTSNSIILNKYLQ